MPALRPSLKLIFVPWGSQDYGDDLWLIENALAFCVQSVLENLGPARPASYSDLYTQLRGEGVREHPVIPYAEQQLRDLAAKAPDDVNGIVDGLLADIRRSPDTDALESVTIAPRVLTLPTRRAELPSAFVFDAFAPHGRAREECRIADIDAFFVLAAAVADSILRPFGIEPVRPDTLQKLAITQSWEAFAAFIKAKRSAKTLAQKRSYYRQALKADPKFFWALFNEAQVLKGERDFAAARKLFLDAVPCAKADPALLGDTYFEIGLCSVSLGDPKTARNFWDQALTYAPDNPTLLVNIAGTYEQESDFERASQLHSKVLKIDPHNYKALVSLGRLCAMSGDIDTAIQHYTRALELRPDDALRHAILGGCYLAKNDEQNARLHFERASELDPPRAKLAPVTGSDTPDEMPAPGEYARQELAAMD